MGICLQDVIVACNFNMLTLKDALIYFIHDDLRVVLIYRCNIENGTTIAIRATEENSGQIYQHPYF